MSWLIGTYWSSIDAGWGSGRRGLIPSQFDMSCYVALLISKKDLTSSAWKKRRSGWEDGVVEERWREGTGGEEGRETVV